MPSRQNQIETAVTAIQTALCEQISSTFDLPKENMEQMSELFESVLNETLPKYIRTTRSSRTRTGNKKRPSGYNMYIKEKFRLIKESSEEKIDGKKVMKELSQSWKGLSETEQQQYRDMATEVAQQRAQQQHSEEDQASEEAQSESKPKSKRALTGYHLFQREEKDRLRAEATEKDIKPVKYYGQAWKALSDQERESWNTRAHEMSAQSE